MPAEQSAIVPLPGAHVALHGYAARDLVILGVGDYRLDGIPRRLVRSSDQQRMSAADNLRRDLRDLIGRLAETQHDLGKALPNGSMVIDLGKPKVLKGLLAKRGQDLRMSRLQRWSVLREDLSRV